MKLLHKITSNIPLIIARMKRKLNSNVKLMNKDWEYKKYKIGDYTYGTPEIFDYGLENSLTIGKFCSIANGVKIFLAGEHDTERVSTYPLKDVLLGKSEDAFSRGGVTIGNDVWIAYGVTILSGVTIGDGCVLGAGTIIAKDVEPYSIVVGNPAKVIKKRFDDATIEKLLKIQWWNWDMDKIKTNINLLTGNINKFLEENK